MVSYGFAETSALAFSQASALRQIDKAKQYADTEAEIIRTSGFSELPSNVHARKTMKDVVGDDEFESKVSIAKTVSLGNGETVKVTNVEVFKKGETSPRYSVQMPISSKGTGFVINESSPAHKITNKYNEEQNEVEVYVDGNPIITKMQVPDYNNATVLTCVNYAYNPSSPNYINYNPCGLGMYFRTHENAGYDNAINSTAYYEAPTNGFISIVAETMKNIYRETPLPDGRFVSFYVQIGETSFHMVDSVDFKKRQEFMCPVAKGDKIRWGRWTAEFILPDFYKIVFYPVKLD